MSDQEQTNVEQETTLQDIVQAVARAHADLYQAVAAVHQAIREQGNALGMCYVCATAWFDQGQRMGVRIPPGVIWAPLGPGLTVPTCLPHFGTLQQAHAAPQLIQAAPGDVPPPGAPGLVVPGR